MTTTTRGTAWRKAAALGILALAAASVGCFNPFSPEVGTRKGVYVPPPPRDTPQGVVRLLEWAYTRRDFQVYRTLFTEDYRFYFDALDSAGNQYRQQPWIRDYELESAQHLFEGGSATEAPATSIDLTENSLYVSDTGDTLDATTHRKVTTAVVLNIRAGGASIQVQGNVDYYVVLYKAAKIPADILSRVSETDWFIYAWIDRTLPGGSGIVADAMRTMLAQARAGPAAAPDATQTQSITVSWGAVKAGYR